MRELKKGDIVFINLGKRFMLPLYESKYVRAKVIQILKDFNKEVILVKTTEKDFKHLLVFESEIASTEEYEKAIEIKRITEQIEELQEKLLELKNEC